MMGIFNRAVKNFADAFWSPALAAQQLLTLFLQDGASTAPATTELST